METHTNINCSLSNAFVQHPQTLFTCVETRIYHAALLCLHRNTADLTSTYTIHLKDLFSKSGNNYKAMHLAIASLLERRWFGEHLFTRLEYFKREGCIELEFNQALAEHLLHDDAYYTCLPVAELQAAGLVNPLAWRVLWLLRSYYRGYRKDKLLTIAQLEELVWAGARESTGYSRLKQSIDAAVASLVAAGLVDVSATTNKRGLVSKGIDFTIPVIHLCATSKPTVADVVPVATPAPVLAAEPVAAPLPAPTPAPVVEPAAVADVAPALVGDKYQQLYTALQNKWQLASWQVGVVREYVNQDALKFEKVRDVIRVINSTENNIKNIGAFTWAAYKNQIPKIQLLAHQKYPGM